MNEAPKKIWVIRDRYVVDPEKACERIVPYIRADLVDGLIVALEMCVKHLDADGNLWSKEEQAMALAALKSLEDQNTTKSDPDSIDLQSRCRGDKL